MFKKMAKVLLLSATLFGTMVLVEEEANAKINRTKDGDIVVTEVAQEIQEEKIASNVGDGLEYAYEITEVYEGDYGVEIHGLPLNKESYTNRGIFLYQSEVSFDVKVGDKIVVVWGEEEDEFELIDRAVQLSNGEYVSATKNRIQTLLNRLRGALNSLKMS